MTQKQRKVAIIGGGPVGLAALAHCIEHQLDAQLFEAAADVAHAIRQWGHVKMFSPASWNIDRAAVGLLRQSGWTPAQLPTYVTGSELVEYYLDPLAQLTTVSERVSLQHRLVSVEPGASRPYRLHFDDRHSIDADIVIDASGTWFNPRQISVFDDQVNPLLNYQIPFVGSAGNYCDKTVAVVGMGDSACNSIFELSQLGCVNIVWLLSGEGVGGIIDRKKGSAGVLKEHAAKLEQLVADDSLDIVSDFKVQSVCCASANGEQLVLRSQQGQLVTVDEVVANIGFQPDLSFYQGLTLALDEVNQCPAGIAARFATGGLNALSTDKNKRSTYEQGYTLQELQINEARDLFIVGMKSYGSHPGFLLKNGYNQVDVIVSAIASDFQ